MWELLVLRDLREKWVLPRLAYAVTIHTADRAAGKAFAFFVARPARRVSELFRTLEDHRESSEIALAGFAVLIAFVRAFAMLLLALAVLFVAFSRL